MAAVAGVELWVIRSVGEERLGEHVERDDSLRDVGVANVDVGGAGWVAGDELGMREVVLVVGSGAAADGEGDGERRAPSSGSAYPLLVVEPLGRHVGESDRVERPDVDACLHRGGDAEDIDSLSPLDLLVQLWRVDGRCVDAPEAGLAVGALGCADLPGELGRVEAEHTLVGGRQVSVVVGLEELGVVGAEWLRGSQRREAGGAGASGGVQVNAEASAARPDPQLALASVPGREPGRRWVRKR